MYYILIQDNNFPPIPDEIPELFLDIETTSFDPNKTSLDVWKSCWVAGIALSWDKENIYFIPIRYRDGYSEEKNNSPEQTKTWVSTVFRRTKRWINHNVKYDYHGLSREGYPVQDVDLFCTLTQAKLIESDRFVYNEDALAVDWLGDIDVDIHKQRMKPWIESSKDWGEIPINKIFPYACHDIDKNIRLYQYILEHMHPDVSGVSRIEQQVTRALARTEGIGLCVDTTQLKIEESITTFQMLSIIKRIEAEHGLTMRPNVNADCYEVFHNQYGLPVVSWTDKEEPSYDKYALATLRKYPGAPTRLIDDCLEYRKHVSHNGFTKSYFELQTDGRLHASYNQCIRTGRMSCSEPNMQQLDKAAKALIKPHPGYVFLSFDFSAIEFRLLAHYLGQPDILEAYAKDPDTDFHQWVADMCHVKRKPAKSINFCMAYGGGKKKVLSMLANNPDVIEELAISGSSPDEFEQACRERAEAIFNKYHSVLYRLRPLTKMSADRLKMRGFVRNGAGRHRHLPPVACYRALNTVIQSFAADIMKAAVINTSPIFNELLREYGVEQVAFVHDDIVFIAPEREFLSYKDHIVDGQIVAPGVPHPIVEEIVKGMLSPYSDVLTVPLRVSASIAFDNWANTIPLSKELTYSNNTPD